MCSSRSGVSLLAHRSSAAVLEGSTAAAGSGRWYDRTAEDAVRDRAAAAAAAASDYPSSCYSVPRMFDDLDRVVEPTWCDLWRDSNTWTHPKNADGLMNVSPTYSVAPTLSSLFLAEPIPYQLVSSVSVTENGSSRSRGSDNDGCTSSSTSEEFSYRSNFSNMGENSTVEFGNSSSMFDCKDSLSLEESPRSSDGCVTEYHGNCGDNQDASFLGYDWASMTDFDDLDVMFSNYSALGGWEAEKTCEVLSPTDSTCSKTSSHILSENAVRVVMGEDSSYHLQDSEECHGKAEAGNAKRSRFSLMEDQPNMNGEEGHRPSQSSSNSDWTSDLDEDETSCIPVVVLSQQGSKFVDKIQPDQQTPGQDDFAVPSLPPLRVAKKQRLCLPYGYVDYCPCNSENTPSIPSSGETMSVMPNMTPLEKIGKLRCNQQMQATLAIHQQQKQFDLQLSGLKMGIPHMASQIDQGSNLSDSICETSKGISRNGELQKINVAGADDVDDLSLGHSQAESALHDLQDTISKLDVNFRTCIRDGLFGLARITNERSNGDDGGAATCSRVDDEVTLVVGMMMKCL